MNKVFQKIDYDVYDRKEYFEHFTHTLPCSYSLTVDLDITKIKSLHVKVYPVLIFLISKVVNRYKNFKMSFDKDENLGYFEVVYPSYTIFNEKDKHFSSIYTPFIEDFSLFYEKVMQDMQKYKNSTKLVPQIDVPKNLFNISAIPWINFSSFNLNLEKGYRYLLPIFTIGKFVKKDSKFLMPLHIQVHHGVCDGYHLSLFLDDLKKEIESFKI